MSRVLCEQSHVGNHKAYLWKSKRPSTPGGKEAEGLRGGMCLGR